MELFFVAFCTANSLMKIRFQEKMLTMDKASDLYATLYKEYVGFGFRANTGGSTTSCQTTTCTRQATS